MVLKCAKKIWHKPLCTPNVRPLESAQFETYWNFWIWPCMHQYFDHKDVILKSLLKYRFFPYFRKYQNFENKNPFFFRPLWTNIFVFRTTKISTFEKGDFSLDIFWPISSKISKTRYFHITFKIVVLPMYTSIFTFWVKGLFFKNTLKNPFLPITLKIST